MLKFSIVIPIFNVERYLRECVNSIIHQTFENFEIILVDDGSPDSCPIICDELSKMDSRIKVIHQPNSGVAVARNNGFKAAQGEYILCLDADDLYADTKFLENLSKVCVGDVDVVQFGYKKYYDIDGLCIDGEIPNHNPNINLQEMLQSVLRTDSYCGCAWAKAVKKNLIHKCDLYFRPGMVAGEDIDWFLRVISCAESFSSLNIPAVLYRQRLESVSHLPKVQSLDNIVWLIEFWKENYETKFKKNPIYFFLMGVLSYYYSNALILYSYFPRSKSKPYRFRLKKMSFLIDYAVTPRARMIRQVYLFVGFDITILLLKLYRKLRRY